MRSDVVISHIVFLGAQVSVRYFCCFTLDRNDNYMSEQFGTGVEVSYGHFGASAEMSWAKLSWVQR